MCRSSSRPHHHGMTPRSTAALLRRHVHGLEHMTASSPVGRVVRAGSLAFTDSGIDIAAFNSITVTGAAWSVGDLHRAAELAAMSGRPWSITVQQGGSTLGDAARLRAVERVSALYGLTERDEDPFLACQRADFRGAATVAAADAGTTLSVATVSAAARVDYTAVVAAGFEVPVAAFGEVFAGSPLDDALVTGYLVHSAGRAIGSGLGLVTEDAVGVHNIAVVREARCRGAGRAVSERVVLDGFARGAVAAYLVSSADGLPLYRSLGFGQVDTLLRFSAPDDSAGR